MVGIKKKVWRVKRGVIPLLTDSANSIFARLRGT